ncbi:hypothetical protein VP01_4819g2 [Puccinia sorghi]|uniref:Uncharacterized protein n=1 Tax=Puccinia sorghi TaxID=27349 RepID=A0A0L6UNA6_9BASI|nr:hypothetical protein VP01_4819g2 [Puccinia sorghi]
MIKGLTLIKKGIKTSLDFSITIFFFGGKSSGRPTSASTRKLRIDPSGGPFISEGIVVNAVLNDYLGRTLGCFGGWVTLGLDLNWSQHGFKPKKANEAWNQGQREGRDGSCKLEEDESVKRSNREARKYSLPRQPLKKRGAARVRRGRRCEGASRRGGNSGRWTRDSKISPLPIRDHSPWSFSLSADGAQKFNRMRRLEEKGNKILTERNRIESRWPRAEFRDDRRICAAPWSAGFVVLFSVLMRRIEEFRSGLSQGRKRVPVTNFKPGWHGIQKKGMRDTCRINVVSCGLRTADCGLQAAGCAPPKKKKKKNVHIYTCNL